MDKQAPQRLVRKLPSGRFQIEIDRRVGGKRTRVRRVLPDGTTEAQAQSIANRMDHEVTVKASAVAPADGWDAYVDGLSAGKGGWLYVTVQNMRHRSKTMGLECTLSVEQLREVLRRSRGRCAITGLRFTTEKESGQRTRPFFHSIDRIACREGYTVDNVRAVCHATNIAMNTWGEAIFAELARGFVFNRYSAFYAGRDGP
jgi:hypothetical protein